VLEVYLSSSSSTSTTRATDPENNLVYATSELSTATSHLFHQWKLKDLKERYLLYQKQSVLTRTHCEQQHSTLTMLPQLLTALFNKPHMKGWNYCTVNDMLIRL